MRGEVKAPRSLSQGFDLRRTAGAAARARGGGVAVRIAVRMAVGVRMSVALFVGFGLVGHDAKFGPQMGKAR